MTDSFVSLNYAVEEAMVDYLIATVDPLQTTASYYTGIGNIEDLQAPAVFVQCDSGTETYPFSNVYDLMVNINVKEMAADTSQLGVLSANIYNAICNPSLKTALNTNNQRKFSAQFAQKLDMRHSVSGDALVSEMSLRIIGNISGSL
jgi:hypothetical protein